MAPRVSGARGCQGHACELKLDGSPTFPHPTPSLSPSPLFPLSAKYTYAGEEMVAKARSEGASVDECSDVAVKAMGAGDTCSYDKCSFNGTWSGGLGPGAQKIFIASYFFDRAGQVSARCSVLGARCSVLSAQCSALSANCSVVNGQWSVVSACQALLGAQCHRHKAAGSACNPLNKPTATGNQPSVHSWCFDCSKRARLDRSCIR